MANKIKKFLSEGIPVHYSIALGYILIAILLMVFIEPLDEWIRTIF